MTTRGRRRRVALALALPAIAACGGGRADAPPARPVKVEEVRREEPAAGLRYSASIQPHEQVSLAFKVGGYVAALTQVAGTDGRLRPLQQGDPVRRGTVLARLATADYQERVHQALAQLAEAEASAARANADADRAESLYLVQALTRPDNDAALAARAAAAARVDAARAQLEAARISLADTALSAPADGVVLSRSVEVGALAGVGTVAFVVADLTRVKAVFGVPDLLVQRVPIGYSLSVTSDAFGAAVFPGRVTAVSPAADAQSRVFGVEVTIPNADGRLKAGMIATVEVAASEPAHIAPGSATVSVSAVVKSARPDSFAVFLIDGAGEAATARAREVRLGRIAGNRVAVEEGLEVGDRVVVGGASLLTDGDRVRVIPGSEE